MILPVFPLPSAVLFPNTVLPLYVFEPRYRSLVEDVSGGDGRFVIALLRPGYEESYEGSPSFFQTGTLGSIEDLEQMEDGQYTLNLVGQERVDLSEIPSPRPYRLVSASPRPELPVDENDSEVQKAKVDLLASHNYLLREISGEATSSLVFDAEMPFSAALNGSCANLPTEPEVRQRLLEMDDPRTRLYEAQEVVNKILQKVLNLKTPPTPEEEQGGWGLN